MNTTIQTEEEYVTVIITCHSCNQKSEFCNEARVYTVGDFYKGADICGVDECDNDTFTVTAIEGEKGELKKRDK